ncbi:MAG: metallophosphoesterase [Candidatus Aminicenantes bacterium]|nr:metallophosphoesterase [Candidatus Aminicenantes bacterium]
MTQVNKTIKRVFISDIHLGDKRSTISGDPPPPYAYGWFLDKDQPNQHRPEMLADLLKNYILTDATIDEVIILGDLFDEWVVPANKSPFESPPENQFAAIANASQNKPVIENLKILAKTGKLTYVTGNHDFLGTKEPGKEIIKNIFPGIRYIGSQGVGAYKTDDGILAEHGHRYTLFNAPWIDGTGFTASMLPFGFYITRLNVQFEAQKGREYGFFDFLWDAIIKRYTSAFNEEKAASIAEEIDKIIIDTFEIFHSNEIFAGQDGEKMDGLDGIPGLVKWEEIEDHFVRIFSDWEKLHPDCGSAYHALINNLFKLKSAVEFVLKKEKPGILLFGHTHHWKFQIHEFGKGPQIYVNTGAWINKRDCTFVRTEFDPDSREHTVGVWRYKDKKIDLLKSGSVRI